MKRSFLHIFFQLHTHEKSKKDFVVEFIDVGKSRHPETRTVFYHQVNGIILVHDLFNKKSFRNLSGWINEIMSTIWKDENTTVNTPITPIKDVSKGNLPFARGATSRRNPVGQEQSGGISISIGAPNISKIPVLIVGTKLDLVNGVAPTYDQDDLVKEYEAQLVNLSTLNHLTSPYSNTEAGENDMFTFFYDKVIASKNVKPYPSSDDHLKQGIKIPYF
jgi:hypothetical protein